MIELVKKSFFSINVCISFAISSMECGSTDTPTFSKIPSKPVPLEYRIGVPHNNDSA